MRNPEDVFEGKSTVFEDALASAARVSDLTAAKLELTDCLQYVRVKLAFSYNSKLATTRVREFLFTLARSPALRDAVLDPTSTLLLVRPLLETLPHSPHDIPSLVGPIRRLLHTPAFIAVFIAQRGVCRSTCHHGAA